ncbi:MAG: hypothetical protein IPG45_13710 [Deltaproteobacteria bacterium]|jgi:hypothetical protein|nr:hypothetical protein [Deltaproteobacteria bacterium]
MLRRSLPLSVLATAGLFGCQDYVFDQKCAESIKEQQLERPAATPTPADILFIVDNSGSMADEQQKLAESFDRFINEIAGSGDYHIAVASTDQASNGGEQQGLSTFTFAQSMPNHLLDSNNADCRPANIELGCFRGPSPATRIIDSSTMDRNAQISNFRANVLVGSCGSGSETGLRATISALEQGGNGECNSGFLRPEANLVVVVVSDEEDTDNTPIAQYVNDLTSLKDPSQIRLAMIVGAVDGSASNCSINEAGACGSLCRNMPARGSQNNCNVGSGGSQCPAGEICIQPGRCENEALQFWSNTNCSWCSYYNTADCCSALAGNRYVEFARAMEARIAQADSNIEIANCRGEPGTRVACLVDTICQNNFGDTLARIARDLVITTEYSLVPAATYPPGVRVRVTGGRFGAGVDLTPGEDFQVNEQGTKLSLTAGDKTPTAGESLDIYYVSERVMNNAMPRGACGAM